MRFFGFSDPEVSASAASMLSRTQVLAAARFDWTVGKADVGDAQFAIAVDDEFRGFAAGGHFLRSRVLYWSRDRRVIGKTAICLVRQRRAKSWGGDDHRYRPVEESIGGGADLREKSFMRPVNLAGLGRTALFVGYGLLIFDRRRKAPASSFLASK